MTHEPTHAAMRAANKILDIWETRRPPSSDAIRDVIDAETGLPQLVDVCRKMILRLDGFANGFDILPPEVKHRTNELTQQARRALATFEKGSP